MDEDQRREFHEALLEAATFEDLHGKWEAAILEAEQNWPKLRVVSNEYAPPLQGGLSGLFRRAIHEDARSRLGNALPCLLFLRWIGCTPDGAGSGLSFCVLHEPDAGHHHCEQDDPGDEEPHGHSYRRRSAA
jgi:hypothetical protein